MEGQRDGGGYGVDDGCGELQVSVSFGRFDKDSLSWEKWSSFSPNKYLEEVEKCATPGSVASKAAYFEAHYRRIAARKAELLLLASSSSSSDVNGVPPSREALEEGYHSLQKQPEEEEEEEEQNDDDMITLEKERLSFEVVLGESSAARVADRFEISGKGEDEGSSVKDDPKAEEKEETPVAFGSDAAKRSGNDIISREEVADCKFTSTSIEIESAARLEMGARIREDTAKLESWRKPHKMDPLQKEKIMEKAKKKPAPAIIKSPQVYSTPRMSKPTSITPAPSVTKSLRNPGSDVSAKMSKGGTALDLKKVSPIGLRRSTTSSNPPSFSPTAVVAPRRSLIMERMGDKDIIKRAFKTFQNNVGPSKSFYGERSPAQKSAPSAVTGDASSTDNRKENMGLKARTAIKKSNEVLPSPHGSRSNQRVEKRIQVNVEINKNPEQKSTVKEDDKSRLQSKSKEQRERDVKRLTQSIGFKATPMPAFYRGQNRPVINQRKMVKKQEIQA